MPEEKLAKKICVDHVNVRISIAFLVLKLIFADLLTTVVLILLYSAVFQTGLQRWLPNLGPSTGLMAIIVLTIIESVLTIYVVLEWVSEYYEISPHDITHKRGVIFKKVDRYGIQNIKQVVVEQGVLGKMFRYGTLNLFDWRLSKCAELYAVHNPMRYMKILEGLLPNVDEHKATVRTSLTEEEDEDISA